MAKRWIIEPPSEQLGVARDCWGVPAIVAQILLNREVAPDESGQAFLHPKLGDLLPPKRLPGLTEAADLIVQAIQSKRKIVLYGDYDVDGTTGVAILWHMLTLAGAVVTFYVPHRVEEGYGLNRAALSQLVEEGAELIISIDCGITAVEEAVELRQRGVQFVVTDHHTPGDALPEADAIVHPGLTSDYPNPDLCGAGVAFKLAWGIAQKLSGADRVAPAFRDLLTQLLPLAALGTIADIVPLRGENRAIARHGLAALPRTTLPGLMSLLESSGLTGSAVSGYDVGFKLAPRINAAGRMGHARLAIELFTRATAERAREIAMYLEDHNRSRQATERRITAEACDRVEAENLASDARRAIVLASETWHPGVIGIVASRLVSRYHRPVVMIALGDKGGQGSARSVRHFHLAEAFASCTEHLVTHGGHAMAAGLRIDAEKVEAFTQAFVECANNRLTGADLVPKLRLDAEVALEELSLETAAAIAALGPFGQGHPKPKLATGWIELAAEPRCVGKSGDHLQASFVDRGTRMKAIGFGLGGQIEELKKHRRCRVAFEPIINEFNGRRTVEMQMLDLQFPS